MIPDLRARLKASAEKVKMPPATYSCMVKDTRAPLVEIGEVGSVRPADVYRLGLEDEAWDMRRALFIDTETTGLRGAGTVAFLVGMGWIENDTFVVRQYLMRDYPEETDMLEQVAALLTRFTCIVTFNGKSFDIPLLKDRFTMARMRVRWDGISHLDLMHTARRTWRRRLASCTLSQLEREVLGISRVGDLPGAEAPERFFQYLKTGDFTLLEPVLCHNLQDIRTLAVLLSKLSGMYSEPESQMDMLDVFSIGCALEKRGERERARRCFRVASVSTLSHLARTQLALSHRRAHEYREAAEIYYESIRRGEGGPDTYIDLAIILERYLHDPEEALRITEKALFRFAGNDFLRRPDADTTRMLEQRRARLKKKIRKSRDMEDENRGNDDKL